MYASYRADVLRFHRSDAPPTALGVVKLVLLNGGLQALFAYRLDQWIRHRVRRRGGWPWRVALPFTMLLSRCVGTAFGIHLDPRAQIGAGLYIGHVGGIHVGSCHVGVGCSIHQRVRLVSDDDVEGPRIGDRVWIGCHASVMGPVRVGDGATIGAGSVVVQDVPASSLVLGSPARITLRNYDNAAIL